MKKIIRYFKKPFFTKEEHQRILACIQKSEAATSAEIRVYIESSNPYIEPAERAKEIFFSLNMQRTVHRNAVLIYIAHHDHEFSFFADANAYKVLDKSFWSHLATELSLGFSKREYTDTLCACILSLGNKLTILFPHSGENKNELPDEIVFGK